jgi:hypothetical protein
MLRRDAQRLFLEARLQHGVLLRQSAERRWGDLQARSRYGEKERVTRVAREWELGGDGWPTVSPDGRWLAYIRGISGSRKELRVRNLATGEERLLGADSRLIHLAWSQDSKTVLAAITIWTGTEIQAFPRDGGASYQIYTTPPNIVDLATGIELDTFRNVIGGLEIEIPDRRYVVGGQPRRHILLGGITAANIDKCWRQFERAVCIGGLKPPPPALSCISAAADVRGARNTDIRIEVLNIGQIEART